MTFLQACARAAQMAEAEGAIYYVYEEPFLWRITSTLYGKGWLFRAYPGGRKEMSEAGAVQAEREEVNVRETP